MAVNALVWNLENFGVRYGTDGNGYMCELARCEVIAAVVADANVQVLVIQELCPNGVALLPILQALINGATGTGDWHFDWIPGSVPYGNPIPPAVFGDLGFTAQGNGEGYAVLYRQAYLTAQPVARSAGQDTGLGGGGGGGNFIDVVTTGQTLAFNAVEPMISFAGPAANLGFPIPNCPPTNIVHVTRGGIYNSNDVVAAQFACRRACTVQVTDPTVAPAVNYPLVVYHTPASSPACYYGALIGFASQQLQVGGDKAYCGDLNVAGAGDQANLRAYSNVTLGYGSQTYGAAGYALTSVHAEVFGGGAWNQGLAVLTTARDYGFATGAPAVSIAPVLNWIGTAGTVTYAALHTPGMMAVLAANVVPTRAARYPANVVAVANGYFTGIHPGGSDAATAVALIFNLLLSDHLPVLITRP
jgi:hypothetical protein